MNAGFVGYPKRARLRRSVSTSTAAAAQAWNRLELASAPDANSLTIYKNGTFLAPSNYTLSGQTVTFNTAIAPGDIIVDTYLTGDQPGQSRFSTPDTSLFGTTLSLAPTGYWPLNDTSGTSALDYSGNSRNATYQNSPTKSQTPIFTGASRCVQLNGSSQYAEYNGTAFDSYTSAWSLQAVIKVTTATDTPIFSHIYSTKVPFAMMIGLDGSATNKFAGGFYNGSWRLANESGTMATSTAYHLVVTWDGTTITLYKNGSSVGTNTPGSAAQAETSNTGFRIGAYWLSAGTHLLAGYISDVAIWNTALSSGNVTTLYGTLS